jgi:hypothetical protein
MNDMCRLIAFKVNGTLKAILGGIHQHPAQIFFDEQACAKRQIVEWIQQIYPTGKSPQKPVNPSQ